MLHKLWRSLSRPFSPNFSPRILGGSIRSPGLPALLHNHPYTRRQWKVDLPCSAKLIPYRPSFVPLWSHSTLETLIPVVSLPSRELICRCSCLSPDAWATRSYRGSGSCPSAGSLPLLWECECDWISTFTFHSNLLWRCSTVVWGTRALDHPLNSHLLAIALPPRRWISSMVAFCSPAGHA